MDFTSFGLDPRLLTGLAASGYLEPTRVQAEAIPPAMEGHDLLVSAETGSGKTAAFMLPGLQRLITCPRRPEARGPRILVLTPTRELAAQVEKAAQTYGRGLRSLRCALVVGGASFQSQQRALERSVDILVATPGRLLDHLGRGRLDLGAVELLVLDEADRMLDMGFAEAIDAIVAMLPGARQTVLFSATLDGGTGVLARRLTRSPRRIDVIPPATETARIEQHLFYTDDLGHKSRVLDQLLRDVNIKQVVVFTATKRLAEDLSGELRARGFEAASLHGDLRQHERTRTLDRMRSGRLRVLVATDVAARGLDVVGISHVINFDLPRQVEDYVHRIGRTGRAGRSGVALSLAAHRERGLVRSIERFTGQEIAVREIAGFEPRGRPVPGRRPPGAGARDARPGHRRPDARPSGGPRGSGAYAGRSR